MRTTVSQINIQSEVLALVKNRIKKNDVNLIVVETTPILSHILRTNF